MNDTRHFLLTCLILIGGPILCLHDPQWLEFVKISCGTVVGVWFGSKAKSGTGNGGT